MRGNRLGRCIDHRLLRIGEIAYRIVVTGHGRDELLLRQITHALFIATFLFTQHCVARVLVTFQLDFDGVEKLIVGWRTEFQLLENFIGTHRLRRDLLRKILLRHGISSLDAGQCPDTVAFNDFHPFGGLPLFYQRVIDHDLGSTAHFAQAHDTDQRDGHQQCQQYGKADTEPRSYLHICNLHLRVFLAGRWFQPIQGRASRCPPRLAALDACEARGSVRTGNHRQIFAAFNRLAAQTQQQRGRNATDQHRNCAVHEDLRQR